VLANLLRGMPLCRAHNHWTAYQSHVVRVGPVSPSRRSHHPGPVYGCARPLSHLMPSYLAQLPFVSEVLFAALNAIQFQESRPSRDKYFPRFHGRGERLSPHLPHERLPGPHYRLDGHVQRHRQPGVPPKRQELPSRRVLNGHLETVWTDGLKQAYRGEPRSTLQT
jgi:hypothetical protein